MNTAISASYWPLLLSGGAASDVFVPTAITVAASGPYVYVAGYDSTTSIGYVFGFDAGSDGTLTSIPGFPLAVGIHPSAVASDASGAYLYVTDSAQNLVYGFQINGGALTALSSSPFAAGGQPGAIVLDANAKYAFVANGQDSNLTCLLRQFRQSNPAGLIHNGNAARCNRYRPFAERVRVYRKFPRQQRIRVSVELHRWFSSQFAVFTVRVQCKSDGGRSNYAWKHQEVAPAAAGQQPACARKDAIRLDAAHDSSTPFRAFTMTDRNLNQHSRGLTLTARDEGSA